MGSCDLCLPHPRPKSDRAVQFFSIREEADAVVEAWDRDETEQVGVHRVECVEFETTAN